MEGREGMSSSGVTVVGSDAPADFHVAPRAEISSPVAAGAAPVASAAAPAASEAQQAMVSPPSSAAGMAIVPLKKKRGRPRKYGPDGTPSAGRPLSPKPISSSAPPVIDFSSAATVGKRGRARGWSKHQQQFHNQQQLQQPSYGSEKLGDWPACSVGANFTPHIITVDAGEDVTMKVISFSQQGPRAICILSAIGVISSVTLRQADSSGGTMTYEGRFEILSLSGSFMPTDSVGTRSRSGGMSVSLASPDGRVVGGGVAGLLVAATPVQVVVGSFLTGNQHEQKPRKQKAESFSTVTATATVPTAGPGMEEEPYNGHRQPGSATARTNFSSSASFRGDNWSSLPSDSRNKQADINVTLPVG